MRRQRHINNKIIYPQLEGYQDDTDDVDESAVKMPPHLFFGNEEKTALQTQVAANNKTKPTSQLHG